MQNIQYCIRFELCLRNVEYALPFTGDSKPGLHKMKFRCTYM